MTVGAGPQESDTGVSRLLSTSLFVPFSDRLEASAADLGNHSGAVPLRVLSAGAPLQRLGRSHGRPVPHG